MNNEINIKETMSTLKPKKTTVSASKFKKTIKKKVTSKKETTSPKSVTVQKFTDLEGKFLLVKVGNDEHPATDSDIEDIESKLVGLLDKNNVNCLAFVTHHAVEIELIEHLKPGTIRD